MTNLSSRQDLNNETNYFFIIRDERKGFDLNSPSHNQSNNVRYISNKTKNWYRNHKRSGKVFTLPRFTFIKFSFYALLFSHKFIYS